MHDVYFLINFNRKIFDFSFYFIIIIIVFIIELVKNGRDLKLELTGIASCQSQYHDLSVWI